MYRDKKFLAVVPARSGSKGIPNKNIIKVKGKPLIDYTISEALKSKYLDKIIVSTDSEHIKEIALNCGAEVPFLRPIELASDKSKTIDAIIYTLKELEKEALIFDYLVLLQPTQPLRKSFHIDEAIELIIKKNQESLVSISKVKEHPILIRSLTKEGTVKKLLDLNSSVPRQEFPDYYKVDGIIYINKISSITPQTSMNDNTLAYIIERKYALDIDEPLDLDIFKLILENNLKEPIKK